MTETYHTTQSLTSSSKSPKESCLKESTGRRKLKNSSSSSSLNSSFGNLNTEIKSIIENEHDLSFSSESNSEAAENKADMDYLFSPKFWRSNNDSYSLKNDTNTQDKNSVSGKAENKKVSIPLKCSNSKSIVGISEGSNKQSTQSNEDEEQRMENLQNASSYESNNNSSDNNENEENEKEKEKKKEEKENISMNNFNINTQNMKFRLEIKNGTCKF